MNSQNIQAYARGLLQIWLLFLETRHHNFLETMILLLVTETWTIQKVDINGTNALIKVLLEQIQLYMLVALDTKAAITD